MASVNSLYKALKYDISATALLLTVFLTVLFLRICLFVTCILQKYTLGVVYEIYIKLITCEMLLSLLLTLVVLSQSGGCAMLSSQRKDWRCCLIVEDFASQILIKQRSCSFTYLKVSQFMNLFSLLMHINASRILFLLDYRQELPVKQYSGVTRVLG